MSKEDEDSMEHSQVFNVNPSVFLLNDDISYISLSGGFSAGYFNTVGSVEGFKPSTFTSSRSQRANVQTQSIESFIDENDGLIGGRGQLTTQKVK